MNIKRKMAEGDASSHRLFCRLLFTLVISLLLPTCIFLEVYGAGSPLFPDVNAGEWFGEAVVRAKGEGILEGYEDGYFRPHQTVTYGEFLRMAVKKAPTKRQGHWARGYYEEGIRRRIFIEEDISKEVLNKCISRKYMALVFAGLLKESGATQTHLGEGENMLERGSIVCRDFCDIGSRSAFNTFIKQSAAAGILNGYPDHTFRPENFLTRAEAATAFVRLSDVLAEAAAEKSDATRDGNDGSSVARSDPPETSIEDVMDPVYKAYLDSILASLRVSGSGGNYQYSFEVPQAPGESEVFFKITFFSKTGAQILNNQTYRSKDSSPRIVRNQIRGLRSLCDLGTVIFDFGIISKSIEYWHDYMLTWEADSSLNLRTDYWKRNSNKGFSEYSTRALDYVFSWQ